MTPRVLYIDGFNLFLANFHANRELNENGEPIGGLIGSLRQMKNLVYKLSPHKVVIVFDGPSAGLRRRSIFKEYKGKRPPKARDFMINLGDKQEKDLVCAGDEKDQLVAFFEVLKLLPVNLLIIPYYEADDVIAYLVKKNKDYHNTIVSNDKDYLQLVEDNTDVYQFSKNRLVTKDNLQELYGVRRENFLFFRTIVGDPSDELKGIGGIGEKSVLKYFPAINEEVFEDFSTFWNRVEDLEESKGKTITKLKEGRSRSFLMYRLMRLDETTLNQRAIEGIQAQVNEQYTKPFSKFHLKTYCIKNHLNLYIQDFELWIHPFTFLNNKLVIHS